MYSKIGPSSIKIRIFEREDAIELSNLIYRTLHVSNSKDYSFDQIAKFKNGFTPQELVRKSAKREMYVADIDGELVGTVSLVKHRDVSDAYMMLSFFVSPEQQNSGIGKTLLQYAELRARALGGSDLYVPSSKTAYGFYLKFGYKDTEIGRSPNTPFMMRRSIL